MRIRGRYIAAWVLLAIGCRSGATPGTVEPGGEGSVSTGIEGRAYREPTRPVCQVDQPCNVPFSGGFEVWQGERVVARFQSDSAGHFLVRLAPGTYRVVPDASAPLLIRTQGQQVTVKPSGLTQVEFNFDSGIR